MKKDDKFTEQELKEFAQAIHKEGSRPSLSRSQKKIMLKSILPRRPLLLRMAPAFSAAFLTGILLIGSLSFASQPGDALYGVKRGIEDVRSVVQPSYNEKLLQKRNDEIEDLNKKGGDDDKLDIVNKEKQEIEKRLKSRDDNAGSDAEQHNDSTEDHDDSEEDSESHSDRSTSTESSSMQQSNEEQCKASLDSRKDTGESINSDMYKQCED